MIGTTSLVVACGDQVYEQHLSLFVGKERVGGCSVEFARLAPGEMLFRAFEESRFNVAELSLSNFVNLMASGDCPYVALPVYVKRVFVHGDFYVRTDRGISTPGDLAGRRIGIAEYQHTAYVWARGLLQHEFGIHPSSVKWVSKGVGPQTGTGAPVFAPPPGVSIEHISGDATLSGMLEHGDIDALISPRIPDCYQRQVSNVSRLLENHQQAEKEYLLRTGIFPILHIMGVRRELIESNPRIALELSKAFRAARSSSGCTYNNGSDTASPLPRSEEPSDNADRMKDGFDLYGLQEQNQKVLSRFLQYHFEQGLSTRLLSVEQLFSPISVREYGT